MKESILMKANAIKGINEIAMKGEIVVFGSTYMANFPFYELINKCNFENAVYNRSIEKMTLDEAYALLEDCVIAIKPSKVFLSLGEEDECDEKATVKYTKIVRKIQGALPTAKLYLICLTGDSDYVKVFNENLRSLSSLKNVEYIEFSTPALTPTGIIKARFKQMSHFFRNSPLNMADAFSMAEV